MSYLVTWLFEINPLRSTGFGYSGISWNDILAWSQLLDRQLTHVEAVFLYQLSQEYAAQYNAATDKTCAPPFIVDIEEHRKKVSDTLDSILMSMMERNNGRHN